MKLSGLQRAAQLGKCSLSGPNEAVIISRVTQMQSREAANSRLGREKQKSKVFPGLGVTDVGSDVGAKQGLGAGSPNGPPPSPRLQVPCEHVVTGDRCSAGADPQSLEVAFTQANRGLIVSENDISSASEAAKKSRHPQKGHSVHALNGGNRD